MIITILKTFFVSIILLLITAPVASADNFLGIDNPPTSWGYHGKAENLKRWPQSLLGALEAEQGKILLSVKDKRNWSLSRKMEGMTNYFRDKDAIFKLDEEIRAKQIARDDAKGLVKFWYKLTDWWGSQPKEPSDTFFSASDTIRGPQDCSIPDKQGPDDNIIIRRASFNIEGSSSQTEGIDEAKEKYAEYYFIAEFLLTSWNCRQGSPLPTAKESKITIDWNALEQKSQVKVANFFDKTFVDGLKAKYNIDVKIGDEAAEIVRKKALEKLDQAVKDSGKKEDQTIQNPSCILTDETSDHKNLINGGSGSIASSDLRLARITKTNDLLTVYIESYGHIPQLDENSSQAYEIGFDSGNGGSNPLSPRDGADMLFVIDVAKDTIRGFKETRGSQKDWQPVNVNRLLGAVQFSIPISEISQDQSIPPLRIYASSAIGNRIEFDVMENGGMKKCF